MALIQLVYVSSMVGDDESQLGAILEDAVKYNDKNGITGMLLYTRGNFIQVLEGPPDSVHHTYARICLDPRHQAVTFLSEAQVEQRHFPAWSMGYKRLSPADLAAFPEYDNLFNFETQPKRVDGQASLALEMLTMFSDGLI
ncbi:MAG: BLUF domain-containing protein [Burkholderiales bacterium]